MTGKYFQFKVPVLYFSLWQSTQLVSCCNGQQAGHHSTLTSQVFSSIQQAKKTSNGLAKRFRDCFSHRYTVRFALLEANLSQAYRGAHVMSISRPHLPQFRHYSTVYTLRISTTGSRPGLLKAQNDVEDPQWRETDLMTQFLLHRGRVLATYYI